MNNYLILDENKTCLVFGMEWSSAYYYALNCKLKDDKHYPEVCYEVCEWKNEITCCKKFNTKGKSVEDYALLSKARQPSRSKLSQLVKYVNQVEPS